MTVYEYLKVVQDIADVMRENGISVDDARYVQMFADYERLSAEGHKKSWIVAYLCECYGIKMTKFYGLVAKMRREVVI